MKLELEVEQEKKSTYLFTKLYLFYFKRILTFFNREEKWLGNGLFVPSSGWSGQA